MKREPWWPTRQRKEMMLIPKIWNLYVIRLDDDAKKYNPNSATHDSDGSDGRCVYVGCTTLTPEERLEQHKKDARSNKKVRKEYFEFLMPSLFEHLNIGDKRDLETYEQASVREVELARSLESQGFIVWCYTK